MKSWENTKGSSEIPSLFFVENDGKVFFLSKKIFLSYGNFEFCLRWGY
jgi:hypothetical protein